MPEKIMPRSPFGPLTETVPATRITEHTADIMRRRIRELGCTSESEYVRHLIEVDCHGLDACRERYRSYFESRFSVASKTVAESNKPADLVAAALRGVK